MRFTSTRAFARRMALFATVAALAAAPVQAVAPPDGKGGGGGTSNNTAPKFDVWVVKHTTESTTLWHPSDFVSSENLNTGYCTGETPDSKSKDIVTIVFFYHQTCATLTTTSGATLTDDLTIRTHTNSDGDIVSIQVEGQDVIGSEGIVHQSEMIYPANAPVTPVNGIFTIEARDATVEMFKCNTHTIKRNTVCDVSVGTFAIDDVRYEPRGTTTSIESTIRYAPGEKPD